MMRQCGIKVAVIDNGVCKDGCFGINIDESYIVTADGKVMEYWCTEEESIHGTVCAAIIGGYAPEVSIVSLKVMNKPIENKAVDKIITALKWCDEHRIKVCHLSIGVTSVKYYDRFRSLIRHMREKGHIIIAAMANDNRFTLPACVEGVISVKAEKELFGEKYYRGMGRLGEPTFFASGRHCLKDVNGNDIVVEGENSFAAPVITAQVVKRFQRESEGSGLDQEKNMGSYYNSKLQFDYIRKCFGGIREVSVPVVVFWGEKYTTLEQIYEFRQYLEERDFLAIIVSDRGTCEKSELMISVTSKQRIQEYLGLIQEYYNIDILLIYTKGKDDYSGGDLYIGEEKDFDELIKILLT